MGDWRQEFQSAHNARWRRVFDVMLVVMATCLLLLAWATGRNLYAQLYWPRVAATVLRAEKVIEPNGRRGVREYCSLDVSWKDPNGQRHNGTFSGSLSECIVPPEEIVLAYNPRNLREAERDGSPLVSAISLAATLATGALLVVGVLRSSRRPHVTRA